MLNSKLIRAINELRRTGGVHNVVPYDLNASNVFAFNLTDSNESLSCINVLDNREFFAWSDVQMKRWGTEVAIGLFNEDRNIYARSELFDGDEPRIVHLGIDISAPHGTEVFAPLDAVIHSFADNSSPGDYGPTIILTHNLGGIEFFTLYGHLSRESLVGKRVGDNVFAGQAFAQIGSPPTNGDWPPHLHFQVITNMLGKSGDFPGVSTLSDREMYLRVCLDPNLILGIDWFEDLHRRA